MTEPTYLKCTRPHQQKDKDLKFVCLMEACRENSLCCEECLKDSHEGHKKKELKGLLTIANYLKTKGSGGSGNSQTNMNRGNLLKIVDQNESKTVNSFKALRQTINATLDRIESDVQKYFDELNNTIKKPHGQQDPAKVLDSTLNDISNSKDYSKVVKGIQKLLLLLNKVGNDGSLQPIENHQEVLEKMVAQSNKEINDLIDIKLTDIKNILAKSQRFIVDSISNAQDLWEHPLFHFSPTLHHDQIKVQTSAKVSSGGENIYQMALMEPQININSQHQVFRFKITKLTSNWVAVGIGSKKIMEQNQFLFDPYNSSHGTFMISANGGSWAHLNLDLNGKVRAFKFEEDDIITCIVDPEIKKIYFVKETDVTELVVYAKETFELSYANFQQQDLHPCVIIHYLDNIVEYIPATNSSQIPKYDYLFSESLKHSEVNVINNKSAMISDDYAIESGYRSCLFNKPVLGEGSQNSTKSFSFRIATCSEDWIGVGICKRAVAEQNNFGFDYEKLGHGYFMISSNGGVWSDSDESVNNKLDCWKFKTGDVVDCEVGNGDGPGKYRLVFKMKKHKYSLNFECKPQDKFYPCVMLHYVGDEVAVLPLF